MLEFILAATLNVFSLNNLLFSLIGLVVGTVFGALPGFSATMAVAVMVPFSYVMDPQPALLLLSGVYCGGVYGGSIPAILIGIPGTPASAPTAIEGRVLTQRGESGKALGYCTLASAFGGFCSAIALLLCAPLLAQISMKVGPPENVMIAIFGLSVVCMLSEGNLVKGLLIGFLSLLIGTVGQDPLEGFPRFTFGYSSLIGGLSTVPIMIGIYSIPQVFNMLLEKPQSDAQISAVGKMSLPFKKVFGNIKNLVRSVLIGIGIGIVPAAGPDVAAFVSYNESKKASKTPEDFGGGSIEGIVASEAANNAVTGGSLIPLITLGIPGSAPAAIFLGAMMLHGLTPGPTLFVTSGEDIYTLIVGFAVINIMLLFVGYFFCKSASYVMKIPQKLLAIVIVVLATVGSYSINQNMVDVIAMFCAGVVGYVLSNHNYPMSPIALSLLLGSMLEKNITLTNTMYDDIFLIFQRPMTVIFTILAVSSIAFPFVRAAYNKIRKSKVSN